MLQPPSSAPRHLQRWTTWAPGVVVAAIAWLLSMIVPLTSGAFWPVAAAQAMLDAGSTTLASDPISALPIRGGEWVVQPWLPALLMRGVDQGFGIAGLSVLQGTTAMLVAVLVYRLARGNAEPIPAALAAICSVVLMFPATLRTEQFAIVLGALLLLAVRGRGWWIAPLLVAGWANVHGSFPLALLIVVGAASGLIRRRRNEPMPLMTTRRWVRVAWLVACVGAVMANPIGTGVLEYVAAVRDVPDLRELTPVWRGLDPIGIRGVLLLVILTLLVLVHTRLGSGASDGSSQRWAPGEGLLPLVPVIVLAIATFRAERYAVWLALVLAIELADVLGRWWRHARWGGELHSRIIAATLLLAAAVVTIPFLPGLGGDRFARAGLPERQLLDGVESGDVVLASAEWADYVHLRTGARIVVDARLERYRPEDLRRYIGFLREGDAGLVWTSGADSVLLRNSSAGRPWRGLGAEGEIDGVDYRRVERTERGARYEVV